jgi:hypothetical protein
MEAEPVLTEKLSSKLDDFEAEIKANLWGRSSGF